LIQAATQKMATATDCDFLAKIAFGPDGREKFFNNPSGQLDSYHFTPHDVHDTYDAIDVNKNQELKQDGKVVLITGARGIGRVSKQFTTTSVSHHA